MRMIGPSCHEGPGGRDCACCNVAPGKGRRRKRRSVKRSERQDWKRYQAKLYNEWGNA